MRSISSGVAGGSSLALAWKALSVLDRPAAIDPLLYEAVCPRPGFLDWFSFSAGICCGILLFAFVELVVTCRWLLVAWVETARGSGHSSERRVERPLYKIL